MPFSPVLVNVKSGKGSFTFEEITLHTAHYRISQASLDFCDVQLSPSCMHVSHKDT